MIFNQRIQNLQKQMQANGLEVSVYATSASLQYLLDDSSYYWQRTPETGFYAKLDMEGCPPVSNETSYFHFKPDAILFVPAQGSATLLATFDRAARFGNVKADIICHFVMLGDYLSGLLHGEKVVGVGLACESALKAMLLEHHPALELQKAEPLVEALRLIKDSKEIVAMRRVAEFTDACMAKVEKMLRPGVTQWEVETELNRLAVEHGCQDVPFTPTCSFTKTDDPRCMDFHGIPKDEPLTPGTAIAFDNGFVMDGYCSDFGRSFYCGKAPEHIAGAYKALQTAQLELFEKIRPGVSISITFRTIYETMERFGYAKWLRNFGGVGLMGHQIGIDVHEGPWLHDNSVETFKPGMTMCIEPKVFIPGQVFMRVEDMVLITENGCESLTKFDRELYELPLD